MGLDGMGVTSSFLSPSGPPLAGNLFLAEPLEEQLLGTHAGNEKTLEEKPVPALEDRQVRRRAGGGGVFRTHGCFLTPHYPSRQVPRPWEFLVPGGYSDPAGYVENGSI